MNIKSASGIVIYTSNLEVSRKFYESLGLEIKKKTDNSVVFYINLFWIELRRSIVETNDPVAGGPILYLKVEDADEYYLELLSSGIDPGNKPRLGENNAREFSVCDPDGYMVAIFSRK